MMCQLGQAEERGAEFCWAILLGLLGELGGTLG